MASTLKTAIQDDMKEAMRAKDKDRLGTIRLILAALKQREVDERIELTDGDILAILDKMLKQRRDSIDQYQKAQRADLVAVEEAECQIIRHYLPTPLTEAEIDGLIDAALAESGAASVKELGKVMNLLKPQIQGRADMSAVSGRVKARFNTPS